ncbi:MAG: FAD-binding oxidoreductase [Armatimonadetes bacterium]|nr:FAD-binding oxidoreductase [Armatimonadota bacterium]
MRRLLSLLTTLASLRRHDLRAARTWINTMYSDKLLPVRLLLFLRWATHTMWRLFPDSQAWAQFEKPVSGTSIWLKEKNPFENHPFSQDPDARLPEDAEVVVIGAGFIGGAVAYHWSKLGNSPLVVLEKEEVAGGSAGRNEGLVVMGRYYYMVYETVMRYLNKARTDLTDTCRDQLAHEFAAAYAKAAYANAELIEQTIREEGIECEYQRRGWVQATERDRLDRLEDSVRMAERTGFNDWVKITREEAFEISGINTPYPSGYSRGAATWHPAKWVWGLVKVALRSGDVQLFTRTRVLSIEDQGERYAVRTERGTINARYVVNATESATPFLFPSFHDVILPMQTQAAFGRSDGGTMKPAVGISGPKAFFGRHGEGILFGSDATRVPDREAGRNQPSRFITKYVITQLRELFGVEHVRVANEWSGTVSYTPDEYPIVGLMDDKRMYMIGGLAGSGSGVSFNAGRHVVQKILAIEGHDYYPEKYFSPSRFFC